MITILSFLFFTGLVGVLTWWLTRTDDHDSATGYFLAGRSLSFPLIAGSLLLTNLSTEQLVGLNGAAFTDGLCVMVWEVVCVIALVLMAWFFLPRFLRSGVATVPEYLGLRFGRRTELIANVIFLLAYVAILLPVILYTCAAGMGSILDIPQQLLDRGWASDLDAASTLATWTIVISVGVLGSVYALFGGLRTVAVSDTINGVGLFTGGFLVTWFALSQYGGSIGGGLQKLQAEQAARLTSIGSGDTSVPFWTIFSGIFLINVFYWCTNQQIIQRTLGASSLAEGQKGVLLTGALKLLGPLYLVLPGMIAYGLFADEIAASETLTANNAYGMLVRDVLPWWLTGFFAAALLGAILSSFNSALNSTCTLFSYGVYKPLINRDATDAQLIRVGRIAGVVVAVAAVLVAPLLSGNDAIFDYLQKMNALYFIPLLAVIVTGMLVPRVPDSAAAASLLAGCTVIGLGYFVPTLSRVVSAMHEFQFVGVVFLWLVMFMLAMASVAPRETEFEQRDVQAVDMTPWAGSKWAGLALIVAVIAIYATFADFSGLQ